MPNPDDESLGAWERCLEIDPNTLLPSLETDIGIHLDYPEICGVYGGELRGAAFPLIAFEHLLVAVEMRALMARSGPVLVEIGGGYGGLAFFLYRMVPSMVYYLFDLPHINAVQAYFLHRSLLRGKLALYGETPPSGSCLHLLPAWRFGLDGPPIADCAVSQNSLLELPEGVVLSYLNAMKQILRGPFLSVHPEAPYSASHVPAFRPVSKLVKCVGGFVRTDRNLFPLKRGAVKELFYPITVCR